MKALCLSVFNLYKILQSLHVIASVVPVYQIKAPVRDKLFVGTTRNDNSMSVFLPVRNLQARP